jgi:hypothetical protein
MYKNHEEKSEHMYDLGKTETLMHDISLKSAESIYVKQFKIPDAHRQQVKQHFTEWIKLGVVQPARSKFNSPIFAVTKKKTLFSERFLCFKYPNTHRQIPYESE